jgi:MFS family permease
LHPDAVGIQPGAAGSRRSNAADIVRAVRSLSSLARASTLGLDRQVVLLSIASLVVMLGSSIVSPVLPLYAREFGVSYAGAGMLVSAFAVGRLLFDYAGGALADRVSARLLGAAGALISAASAFLSARATSFSWLVLYRAIDGLGSAFYVITVMAVLARTVPPEQMGKAMGFYQSMILLGVSFGPTVGGVMADLRGLRAPFYVMAALNVAVAVLTSTRLPRRSGAEEPRRKRPPLAAVVRHVRGRTFVYVLLLTFLVFGIRAGTRSNLIPLFGGERGGLGTSAIGVILSASAFANFVVLWHAGSLIDRRGRQRVALPTLVAIALICAGFSWSPSFVNLLVMSSLLGIALGYLAPTPAAMVADLTPREMMGAVIGVYRMAGDFGLLLGPVTLGAVAARFGFEAAFLVGGAFTVLTALIGRSVPETLRAGDAARSIDEAASPE